MELLVFLRFLIRFPAEKSAVTPHSWLSALFHEAKTNPIWNLSNWEKFVIVDILKLSLIMAVWPGLHSLDRIPHLGDSKDRLEHRNHQSCAEGNQAGGLILGRFSCLNRWLNDISHFQSGYEFEIILKIWLKVVVRVLFWPQWPQALNIDLICLSFINDFSSHLRFLWVICEF